MTRPRTSPRSCRSAARGDSGVTARGGLLPATGEVTGHAGKQGRRQGMMAGFSGVAGEGFVEPLRTVDETVLAATVARICAPERDALTVAGDLFGLWDLMPDESAARAALT